MDIIASNLANKYANAFLNLYIDKLNIEDLYHIQKAKQFFSENKDVFLFLKVSAVPVETEQKILNKLFKKLNLIEPFNDLSRLLIAHKRAFLLKDVFEKICYIYEKRKQIEIFEIRCSYELEKKELDIIKNKFLKEKIENKKDIFCEFKLEPNLIAGIRMQSNHYLWEYSVRQKLRKLNRALVS